MVATASVVRTAFRRFLPLVAAVPAAAAVGSVVTAPSGLAGLQRVAWLAAVVQPLALTVGFLVALLALRSRLDAASLGSWRRTAGAAACAVGAWLLGSVLVQPADASVLLLELAAGAGAGLAAFRAPGRDAGLREPISW